MKIKRKKAFFSISAVAKMFSIHQQTIRLYEKEGLITPKRSEGNTRLFAEEDVDRLEEIVYLTHQLGINLAGVQMILRLKKQMSKLQREMNKAFEETQHELDVEVEQSKQHVAASAKQLLRIKQKQAPTSLLPALRTPVEPPTSATYEVDAENWDIEYEE